MYYKKIKFKKFFEFSENNFIYLFIFEKHFKS